MRLFRTSLMTENDENREEPSETELAYMIICMMVSKMQDAHRDADFMSFGYDVLLKGLGDSLRGFIVERSENAEIINYHPGA